MRARRLAPGIWALRLALPYPYVKSVNAYLLEHGDGHVLVDCGSSLGDGWEELVAALGDAGSEPSVIGSLLCTHAHADHGGLAAEVAERTGCRVLMAPGPHPTVDVLRDPTIEERERHALHRRHGTPEHEIAELAREVNGDGMHRRVEPDAVLVGGDTLATRSGAWQVLPAPGHCPDQVMLWQPERRWLIGADLSMPGVRPFVDYGTSADPHGDYLASLDRALALAPELLLPGHGKPVTAPLQSLAQTRAFVRDGADRVRAGLGTMPLTAYSLARLLRDDDTPVPVRQRALSETLSALEHLRARGVARSDLDDDGVLRWRYAGT